MIRRFTMTVLLAATMTAVGVVAQTPSPDHTIDLLTVVEERLAPSELVPKHLQINPSSFGSRAMTTDHAPEARHQLALRVIGLNRGVYVIGDDFVYELLITNTGKTAVPFPASVTQGRFARDMPGAVAARVGLVFEHPEMGSHAVGVRTLYGAPGVSRSIIRLGAGETLSFRAQGSWYLSGPAARPLFGADGVRSVELKAVVFMRAADVSYPQLSSDNTVSVVLRAQ